MINSVEVNSHLIESWCSRNTKGKMADIFFQGWQLVKQPHSPAQKVETNLSHDFSRVNNSSILLKTVLSL